MIPESVLQEALNYLGSKPWAEVDRIIVGIRSNLVELAEGGTYKSIARELEELRTRRVANPSARVVEPARARAETPDTEVPE